MRRIENTSEQRQLAKWGGWLSTSAICTLVLLLSIGLYLRESARVREFLLKDEADRVDLQARLFQQELESVVKQLLVLADGDSLRSFLASGEPLDLDHATHRAAFVSLQESNYDQIRFLDERGWEIIRVDRSGQIALPAELQDKSDRPYFRKAWALEAGQIYVSRFDLNIEHGQIEEPYRPVIRFALPVFGKDGRRGVYVINYLGSNLLDELKQVQPGLGDRMRLLDAQGYWLCAARSELDWSFMFPGREDLTLASTNPVLWSQVAKNDRGQGSLADGGVLSWQQVPLPNIAAGRSISVVADTEYLLIASEVSEPELSSLLFGIRLVFLILTSVLLVAIGVVSSVLRQRRLAREALHQIQEGLAITLHSIGDAVLATDIQGHVTWMNPVAEQLTGWTEAEAVGQSVEDVFRIVNEETRHPAEIPVSKVLATGEIQTLANHTILIARNGREFPIADSAAPIRNKDQMLVGAVLAFRNMTAERQAQVEREQFFNRSRDMLGIASTNGFFKRINPTFSRTLGWADNEFLSQPFLNFVHPDDHDATLREVEKLAVRVRQSHKLQARSASSQELHRPSPPVPAPINGKAMDRNPRPAASSIAFRVESRIERFDERHAMLIPAT